MNELKLADVYDYVSKNIGDFHANRLEKLNNLK
ncbi:MAG: cytosolic protein, partial [Chloroflexi bacterium]